MENKILLVGINSRFNHTNLAIRSLIEYAKANCESIKKKYVNVDFLEFTINQNVLEILSQIINKKSSFVFFSVYIWNVEITFKIINEIKKICSNVIIACGGPEVSYCAEKILCEQKNVDFIMSGEGEITFAEIVENIFYDKECYKKIKGIYFRLNDICNTNVNKTKGVSANASVAFTGIRDVMEDLSVLPFPYPNLENEKNKIFYYESSRGCPFNCSYCLSSIEKKVRFSNLEKVFTDIKRFFNARVPLVKFVDRTFNLIEERYIAIFQFIIDNWNGVTILHFEIAAHVLSDKVFDILKKIPDGSVQFEVGVQSVNAKTLIACGRTPNFEIIEKNVKQIPKTIHMHLDLIAGLPYETLKDFAFSFDKTIALKSEMLQLGFLKILSGTNMESFAKENTEYKWLDIPPYEVLSSTHMSWNDFQFLKKIEKLVDAYYNSRRFFKLMDYIIDNCKSSFLFFSNLVDFFTDENLIEDEHKSIFYFEHIFNFTKSKFFPPELNRKIFIELLRFDFVSFSKCSNFPDWYVHNYNKNFHHAALIKYTKMKSTRTEYAYSEYEEFEINPFTLKKEKCAFLFLYNKPDEKSCNKMNKVIQL